MVVGRVDQCVGDRLAVLDHVIEPDFGRRPSSRATIGPVKSASTTRVRSGCRERARASVRTRVVRPSARWQLVKRMTFSPCFCRAAKSS